MVSLSHPSLRNRIGGCFSLLALLNVLTATAQSGNGTIPPPKEPLLARAPQQAEWTITYRIDRKKTRDHLFNRKKGEENEPLEDETSNSFVVFPKSMTVSKDGNIYREVTHFSNGRKSEKWIVDGLQIKETPGTGRVSRVDLSSASPDFSDYRTSDFSAAQWINKSNYKGVKMLGNRPVYEFSSLPSEQAPNARQIAEDMAAKTDDPANGQEPAQPVPQQPNFVYLDTRTQLPVYVEDENGVRLYEYRPLPERLVVPEKFAKAFDEWKKVINRKRVKQSSQ